MKIHEWTKTNKSFCVRLGRVYVSCCIATFAFCAVGPGLHIGTLIFRTGKLLQNGDIWSPTDFAHPCSHYLSGGIRELKERARCVHRMRQGVAHNVQIQSDCAALHAAKSKIYRQENIACSCYNPTPTHIASILIDFRFVFLSHFFFVCFLFGTCDLQPQHTFNRRYRQQWMQLRF